MKSRSQNMRKAAVLLASLDIDSAELLLAQMTPEQARRLREAVEDLGPIDPAEQSEVIEEFFRIGPMVPAKQPAGILLDDGLAQKLGMPEAGERFAVKPPSRDARRSAPLNLYNADAAALAPLLEGEHPQTVAVVISQLAPSRAAEVLSALPATMQAEVARRLVDLDETDPEIMRDIEAGLESWLSQQARSDRRRRAGVAALSNILESADHYAQQEILANLSRHDRHLARQLAVPARSVDAPRPGAQQVPWSFADVTELDDRALTMVLREAEPDLVVLALAGAAIELVDRVLRQLPLDQRRALMFGLDHIGPTRLSDVEEAQRQLAHLAARLAELGHIERRRKRGLSLAA